MDHFWVVSPIVLGLSTQWPELVAASQRSLFVVAISLSSSRRHETAMHGKNRSGWVVMLIALWNSWRVVVDSTRANRHHISAGVLSFHLSLPSVSCTSGLGIPYEFRYSLLTVLVRGGIPEALILDSKLVLCRILVRRGLLGRISGLLAWSAWLTSLSIGSQIEVINYVGNVRDSIRTYCLTSSSYLLSSAGLVSIFSTIWNLNFGD
jgi:hypothetical protein